MKVLDQILRYFTLPIKTTQPNYRPLIFSTHCSYSLLVGLSLNSRVKHAATLGSILGTCTIKNVCENLNARIIVQDLLEVPRPEELTETVRG